MAKIVLSTEGKKRLLERKRAYLNTLDIYLFTGVTGGSGGTGQTLGDYTLCPDTANDGRSPAFTPAVTGTGNVGEMTAPNITWTFTYNAGTPFQISGHTAVDPVDGQVVFQQVFSPAVTINGPGQQFTLAPVFREDSLP